MIRLLPLEFGMLEHHVVEEEAQGVAMIAYRVPRQRYWAPKGISHLEIFGVDQVKQLVDRLGRFASLAGLSMHPLEVKRSLS